MIEVNTKTEYFAKKNTIYAAITHFKQNKGSDEIEIKATYKGGRFNIKARKIDIIRYLGYDFSSDHDRLRRDKTKGKLNHDKNVLELFEILNNE